MPTVITTLSLALSLGRDHAEAVLVGVTAASQVPVLLLSCLAGVKLLESRSAAWWAALAATIAVAVLLIPAGTYLLAPAAIAAATLIYLRLTRARTRVMRLV